MKNSFISSQSIPLPFESSGACFIGDTPESVFSGFEHVLDSLESSVDVDSMGFPNRQFSRRSNIVALWNFQQ